MTSEDAAPAGAVEATTPVIVTSVEDVDLDNPALYTNRELSWLEFNERVLAEAFDQRNPLLERVKFLAITASNLDEFTAKRLGWLQRAIKAEPLARTLDGLTFIEQLLMVNERCREMTARMVGCWERDLKPALVRHGITVVNHDDLGQRAKSELRALFERSIFPTLTPLAVDPAHPFPFISTQSLSLALIVRSSRQPGEERFARVKVPPNRPRFVSVRDGQLVPLEQVIAAHASDLFPGMEVTASHVVRVIRSADIGSLGEEGDDLLELVENELKRRRLAAAVRLELSSGLPQPYLELLLEELELDNDDVFTVDGLIGLSDLMQVATLEYPNLRDKPYTPALPSSFSRTAAEADLYGVIRERDVLVHHPYESFDLTVAEFIQQSAEDQHVLAIKQTLYRTSPESPVVESLIEAAERGKQVAVLVELTARFDEANNIEWARKLESAGVHVAYGVPGYKIHSKIALVVRQDASGVRLYGHIGTGNYNSRTARIYTDFGLFTADPVICDDLVQVFNYLTGYAEQPQCRRLLVAPFTLRSTLKDLVEREIAAAERGEEARIIMKMNALEDHEFARLLYVAGRAGVKVDLIVRGICRLQPGQAGTGDNIRVVSVVGKYLEHSRAFAFHNGGQPLYWIGSADIMKRNLDERIEVLTPINNRDIQRQLQAVLDTLLADQQQGWRLRGQTWSRDDASTAWGAHQMLEFGAPFS